MDRSFVINFLMPPYSKEVTVSDAIHKLEAVGMSIIASNNTITYTTDNDYTFGVSKATEKSNILKFADKQWKTGLPFGTSIFDDNYQYDLTFIDSNVLIVGLPKNKVLKLKNTNYTNYSSYIIRFVNAFEKGKVSLISSIETHDIV